jgi:hypothetical protein
MKGRGVREYFNKWNGRKFTAGTLNRVLEVHFSYPPGII